MLQQEQRVIAGFRRIAGTFPRLGNQLLLPQPSLQSACAHHRILREGAFNTRQDMALQEQQASSEQRTSS